jgi:hypothetical protein
MWMGEGIRIFFITAVKAGKILLYQNSQAPAQAQVDPARDSHLFCRGPPLNFIAGEDYSNSTRRRFDLDRLS